MVNSLENIDKSKVYVDRIEGLDEVVSDVIRDTLTGAVSTITTTNLTAGKILVSDSNGKVAAGSIGASDIPNDSNVVHRSGNETVAGLKTYTNRYLQKNTALTKGTLPASANWWSNEYTDKNGSGLNNRLACMEYAISTNGDAYTHLRTYKYASNNSDNATLSIVYPITGNPYATAPTPTTTTSTDSTQIATTGWVNKVGNNVVHKTGNETIAGEKTFTNSMTTNDIYAKGNITLGTSTNTWGMMVNFQDTKGKRIARIQPMAVTTTNNRVGMWVNNADNTVEKGIYVDSNGTTYAPTPTTSDNSTKIATTAFVKAQGYITSALKLPNYSSASNKSVGTQYTAANNCMVICNGTISTNGDRQTAISYFYINGAKYLKAEHFNVYGSGSAPFSFTVILQKGQTYKMAAEAYNCTAYKYVEIPLTA